MVKCSVLFEVWTEFLNKSFGFKGLNSSNKIDLYNGEVSCFFVVGTKYLDVDVFVSGNDAE
jgi:hypothetical protein